MVEPVQRPEPVYLDYAATTPVDERVAAAIADCLTMRGTFGNPSSEHPFGHRARERVELARAQAAALIGAAPEDLYWTSGATESNNLAILGTVRAAQAAREAVATGAPTAPRVHVITARSEHKSVLDPCHQLEREDCAVTYLAPDRHGVIAPQMVRAALRPETVLVSIMHVNNEIGVMQDIAGIAALCAERGVLSHVDGAQSAGKVPLDLQQLGVDLLGFTAHKLYGPKGIGALYVRRGRRAALRPLLFGGGQERGLRAGTLPVHQIVGFGVACELARAQLAEEAARIGRLRERLWKGLEPLPQVLLNGHPSQRVPGILNVSFGGIQGESLMAALPELALSRGSACNSDTDEPSYVLRALGRDAELAQAALRFSVGRFTSEAEIDLAIGAVRREVQRLRSIAP